MYKLIFNTSEAINLQFALEERVEKLTEKQKFYASMSDEELNENVAYYCGVGPKIKRDLKERIEKSLAESSELLEKIKTLKWE